MNATLIYWTMNSKQEGFFLDNGIHFHRIMRDDEPVKGREEAARRLAEIYPHQKAIWVDTPDTLHRIAVEMINGERDLDARPLAQIASIVQQTTPHGSTLNRQARLVIKLTEQYEQGQVNQQYLLHQLRESAGLQAEDEDKQKRTTLARLLCELVDSQLA
jgi:hypothetical protein